MKINKKMPDKHESKIFILNTLQSKELINSLKNSNVIYYYFTKIMYRVRAKVCACFDDVD